MAGRDEGTGALIEPRNIDQQGLCTCHNRHSPNIIMYLRFCETKNAPHTEILTLPLEAIYEQDFLPCSYGFRPGRSAHQALHALRTGLMNDGLRWVLDVDIRKYFDSIPHCHLRSFL